MSLKNPTDGIVAQRLGELELRCLRMGWALDASQKEIARLATVLDQRDAEIAELKEAAKSPPLDLGEGAEANGAGMDTKH